MGILLFLVERLLTITLSPFAQLWAIGESFVNRTPREAFQRINDYYLQMAVAGDQRANSIVAALFNDIVITSASKNKFGNPDETVSSVLGKNKLDNTRSNLGRGLVYVLGKLDKNHSVESVDDSESQHDESYSDATKWHDNKFTCPMKFEYAICKHCDNLSCEKGKEAESPSTCKCDAGYWENKL